MYLCNNTKVGNHLAKLGLKFEETMCHRSALDPQCRSECAYPYYYHGFKERDGDPSEVKKAKNSVWKRIMNLYETKRNRG